MRKKINDNWNSSLDYIEDDFILSFPIGILRAGLYLVASRHTIVGVGDDMLIPYSEVKDWLKYIPSSEETELLNPIFIRDVHSRKIKPKINDDYELLDYDFNNPTDDENEQSGDFDDIDNNKQNLAIIKNYFQMIDSLISSYELPRSHNSNLSLVASTINDGYNTAMANLLMEEKDFGKAFHNFKILAEKYGHINPLGEIDQSFNGLVSSGLRYANQLVDSKKFDEAKEIIEYINDLTFTDYTQSQTVTNDYLLPKADIELLSSRMYALKGKNDSAMWQTQICYPILQTHLNNTLFNITNREREDLWKHYSDWCLNFLPSIAALSGDSILAYYTYESVLNGKGILLNADIAVRKLILTGNDSIASSLLLNKDRLSARLMSLSTVNRSKIDKSEEEIEKEKHALQEEINHINLELSFRSKSFDKHIVNLQNSLDAVKKALEDNEVAIEFIVVGSKDFNLAQTYYAMVLKKDADFPEMIYLGVREEIDRIATTETVYQSTELYKKIWLPLMPFIENASCIYFSPDGIFYTTAIEYLPYNDIGDIISYIIPMKRLSSTRMIPYLKKHDSDSNGNNGVGVLYGGIDYDFVSYDDDDVHPNIYDSISSTNNTLAMKDHEFRTAFTNLHTRNRVNPLYGTEEEINNIKGYAENLKGVDNIILISGSEASEESFKLLPESNPTLLHIATHGFYFSEEELEKIQSEGFINSITSSDKDIDDIGLLRSGLIMAGANMTIDDNDEVIENHDDGILTAKEISMVNLLNIDLATLSACQTGLGEIGSDGVVGLQRGFKKAGVNSLLMSLWKVDDEATMLLMTEFYRQLSINGDKTKAIKEAIQYLRSFEGGKYNHPFYWAAFILLDA